MRNPLSGLRFFSVMYVFVHSRRKIRALRVLRAASAQTADNSRAILCRLCARLSRVRPCTLLSAFAQAPRLTRNCFPNRTNAQFIVGLARGCGANGRQFPRDTLSPLRTPQSCTSLYTPFGVYAGSSSDAELLSKRGKCAIHCRACGFSRSCTSLYTPVEKSAPSAPCARLRRKRQTIPA